MMLTCMADIAHVWWQPLLHDTHNMTATATNLMICYTCVHP
jgi:hypothetical protein